MINFLEKRLQAALKYSLNPIFNSASADELEKVQISSSENASVRNDPRFLAIVEAIRFSRKFVLTYQATLLTILLVTSLIHWGREAHRARRRRIPRTQAWNTKNVLGGVKIEERECRSSTPSSSSTTPRTAAPSELQDTNNGNERTPLLAASKSMSSSKQGRLMSRIRAFLLYQPRPIPYVNKTLPTNGATVFILLLVALNIFYTFYRVSLTPPITLVLGNRAGLLFVTNLPWLYLLSAKNTPLTFLTGYSYEALNIFHRRLGELLCLQALIHTLSMFLAFLELQTPRFTIIHFLTSKFIILGILAFVSYETLYFTSLSSFRQRWYETFLALHIVLQFTALFFLFFHHPYARPYVAIALGIFVVDHAIFRLLIRTQKVHAYLNVALDEQTVLISTNWQPPNSYWARLTGLGGIRYGWMAAQHVYICVPDLSKRDVFQAHPFTIASAAPGRHSREEHTPHAWFHLIIRAHDGFSRDLLDYAMTHPTANIRIDGPYGSTSPLDMLRDSDVALLVAGGSGIAVVFPLLWSLLVDNVHNTDIEDPQNRLPRRPTKVGLIWVVHSASHLSWIGDERLRELVEHGLGIVVPEPTADAGRPDIGTLVRATVARHSKELVCEEVDMTETRTKVGVVCSGPDGMNRDVRNECAALIRGGMDVEIEVEKFGW